MRALKERPEAEKRLQEKELLLGSKGAKNYC